jgi:hypothetical protein
LTLFADRDLHVGLFVTPPPVALKG